MIRRKLKKIYKIIFYVNVILGLVDIMHSAIQYFSSKHESSHLLNIGVILLLIINISPKFLNLQFKLNYPAKITEMQSEDGETMDIERIYYIILPALFCCYLSFLFLKAMLKLC